MTEGKKAVVMPAGRKKGGTMFPRIDLELAVKFATKLVSKTHTGPQLPATLFRGVFGSAGSDALIRASALKQYGLMEGSDKSGYKATTLAIGITSAVPEERAALLRDACLKPKVFANLFDTYHGDEVTVAKLKQQAAAARVHPDELNNCAELFSTSAVFAQLAHRAGEQIALVSSGARQLPATTPNPEGEDDNAEGDHDSSLDAASALEENSSGTQDSTSRTIDGPPDLDAGSRGGPPPARAVIHVNVTIDSSFDTDKLERQLALLRRYGAL